MKRFALAAALAVGSLGFAGTADAQYVYSQYGQNPYTGTIYNTQRFVTPFSAQGTTSYYNPYNGFTGQRAAYQNVWGTNLYRSNGYSPYYGGYSRGAYNPGFNINPYVGGYRYGYRY